MNTSSYCTWALIRSHSHSKVLTLATQGSLADGLSPSDRSLVVKVREGNEEAAAVLYHRYARRMFGFVKSQLGEKLALATDPDDIVQSVFRSVFRGMQAGNYNAPPGSTLWNLMAVIAMRKLQRQAQHHSALCRDINRRVPFESAADAVASIEDSASVEFIKICFRETLDMLRPLDQEIFRYRIDGFEIDEISQKIGRSKRTVERSLQKSRMRLSEMLLQDSATC